MKAFLTDRPNEVKVLINGRWQALPDGVRLYWQGNDLLLSAENTRVECIGLRWMTEFGKDARFFGDAWERGYGDLGWQGIRPERVMPWYMMVREDDVNSLLAVKTGCSAFVGWMTDSHSVTLLCDTRSGNQGVLLGKRTLTIGTFCAVFNQPGNAYDFLCAQVRTLCDHPRCRMHLFMAATTGTMPMAAALRSRSSAIPALLPRWQMAMRTDRSW